MKKKIANNLLFFGSLQFDQLFLLASDKRYKAKDVHNSNKTFSSCSSIKSSSKCRVYNLNEVRSLQICEHNNGHMSDQ